MVSFSQLERLLWYGNTLLGAILLLRLVFLRLHRTYLWFFLYLCVSLAQSLLGIGFMGDPNRYALLYLLSQPFLWFLYILIVLELYSLVLRNHRGIASLSRWTLMAGLALSIAISFFTLLPDLQQIEGPYPVLLYYSVVERGIISSLVVFLVLILAFLVWYPVPLSRNLLVHAVVYCVYFLSSTLTLFIRHMAGFATTRTVSTILIGLTTLCLVAWIAFLHRAGEVRTVVLGHRWRPEDEERLVEQLDAINSVLLRSARK